MGKKHKYKSGPPSIFMVSDEVNKAAAHLESKRYDDAIRLLSPLKSETDRFKLKTSLSQSPQAFKDGTPRLIESMLGQSLFERALATKDSKAGLIDLEQADKLSLTEYRYVLALGVFELLNGKAEQALITFQRAQTMSPDNSLTERAVNLGLLILGRTREVKDRLKQPSDGKLEPSLQGIASIRELLFGNSNNSDGNDQKDDLRNNVVGLKNNLIATLRILDAGDLERATKKLTSLPQIDHNPTDSEAAVLATQFFYSGILFWQTGRYGEATNEFREATRLSRNHSIRLGWFDRLAECYHGIAAELLKATICLRLSNVGRSFSMLTMPINRQRLICHWRIERRQTDCIGQANWKMQSSSGSNL